MSAVSDQQWLRQIGVDLDTDSDDDNDVDDAADDSEVAGDRRVEEGEDEPPESSGGDVAADTNDHCADAAAVDLDAGTGADDAPGGGESGHAQGDSAGEPPRPRRYNPVVLGAFAAVVGLAAAVTTLGVMLSGPEDHPPPHPHPVKSSSVPTLAAAPAPTPGDSADRPLPFTASADCPPGASTSAKSIADPDKPSPWICVRHTDGQPLYITLGPAGIERAYVVTAVSIVPGDTAPAQGSGGDPWLQHRVVTLLQWQFNDTAHTVVDQDTGNVHGEAVKPIPGISASKITVIIRHTSRPVAPTPTSSPAPDGGPFGGILGGPAPTTSPDPTGPLGSGPDSDPSDATFAVSSIKIIGHQAV